MKLHYDKNITFSMISPSAWVESPACRWFPRSKIYTTHSMGPYAELLGADNIKGVLNKSDSLHIKEITSDKGFIKYRHSKDSDMALLLNKPPNSSISNSFYTNPSLIDAFENKINLRKVMPDLPYAPFIVTTVGGLKSQNILNLRQRLITNEIVIQLPRSSGGKGTYFISSDNQAMVDKIFNNFSDKEPLLISRRLENIQEYTVQACVAKNNIFVGPLQEQLVSEPYLISDKIGSFKFCGGRIINNFNDFIYQKINDIAKRVGRHMLLKGYRGIFGIDCAISNNDVYIIEVNARKTGLTPLLSSIDNAPDFYAIHCLELLGYNYDLFPGSPSNNYGGGYVVQVYAKNDGVSKIKSGLYDYEANYIGIGFKNKKLLPETQGLCFIATREDQGSEYLNGRSLAFIYSRDELFSNGRINKKLTKLVDYIRGC